VQDGHYKGRVASAATLAELSEKYGPSPRALQNHFAKAGIVKGEKAAAMAAAVREKVLEEELGDQDQLVARAKDIRERAYRSANIVENLVMGQLALVQRDPTQILKVSMALKALSLAAGSLERLHDLKHRALGLDREDVFPEEMPELVIRYNRNSAFAPATFLGRFWSTPSRIIEAFPIDHREFANRPDLGLTEDRVRACTAAVVKHAVHRAVLGLPLMMTGPVGSPVGDPCGGSTETAIV